ncbi:hypothetical protein Hypma_008317 [Hypsizygus marmoreus]|uniref:Uncharacterized protein n=1 Tax=Hypsizygus marmoreus TaxID=39966 RepID=A0A369JXZ4_HYPMA|nr:hypothetical protein Hypma_008317 [Hypsizygus marmoreus]
MHARSSIPTTHTIKTHSRLKWDAGEQRRLERYPWKRKTSPLVLDSENMKLREQQRYTLYILVDDTVTPTATFSPVTGFLPTHPPTHTTHTNQVVKVPAMLRC